MNPYRAPLLHRRMALHMDALTPKRELRRESYGRATTYLIIWAFAAIVVGVAIPFLADMTQ